MGKKEIIIKVNGKAERLERRLRLLELINSRGLSCDKIVIEHNFQIIPKEEWHKIDLQDNDNLEIISFVGGG